MTSPWETNTRFSFPGPGRGTLGLFVPFPFRGCPSPSCGYPCLLTAVHPHSDAQALVYLLSTPILPSHSLVLFDLPLSYLHEGNTTLTSSPSQPTYQKNLELMPLPCRTPMATRPHPPCLPCNHQTRHGDKWKAWSNSIRTS
jgi:hypothetical protein